MTPEDIKITVDNQKLLALTERKEWEAFVRMVDTDMQALDKISSLILDGKSPEEIAREVILRYQTRESVITYINQTIERAEIALVDNNEQKYDIINQRE